MDINEVKEYLTLMDEAGLTALRVAEDGKEIFLERKPAAAPVVVGTPQPQQAEASMGAPASAQDEGITVCSPMVGTCYLAPAPTTRPMFQQAAPLKQARPLPWWKP